MGIKLGVLYRSAEVGGALPRCSRVIRFICSWFGASLGVVDYCRESSSCVGGISSQSNATGFCASVCGHDVTAVR